MKDLAGATISQADYARLQALCVHDTRFPTTFEAWHELMEKAQQQAEALGLPTVSFDLDVDEFEAWASKVGIHPCWEALRAFSIDKRYGGKTPPMRSLGA